MKELVVATRNRGKLKEISAYLDGIVPQIRCATDYPAFPETVEDGSTFADNALKKAREASKYSGLPALADDSGLVVRALDGQPGVYSARYAGESATDDTNNLKLLREMQSVPIDQRQASFVCVMALVTPEGDEQLFEGHIDGTILLEKRGNDGFGYDPLFLVERFDRTMAELNLEEKNGISHRGQALAQLQAYLIQRRG